MATERWAEVQRILDAALALPGSEAQSFIDRECGPDHELHREVSDLYRSCTDAPSFLESPPAQLAAALLDERRAHAGRRIGPYVVTGEAGRGGMGVVYIAERSDGQFQQRVALKVMPLGLESDRAVRRFLEERQILASLAHPGIARLLDGGVTDDELPYFAMEYVEGTRIDRYCDEHQLSIEERLRLFSEVCAAVQYAHQNLIVHRDLKPSNIFVTAAGSVKLLDFGIAKFVSDEAAEGRIAGSDMTRTGARWLTPRYASPEQLAGQPVTTVSDVYALGVLLYELVTGHSPYPLDALAPAELSRAVCETDVVKPSAAVSERLARRLRGDIDTIVLTAMQKDPSRRYASPGACADDVQRHLARQPVRARPDTLRYRASKFVQRHRVGASVGAALALSLAAGAAGIVWQSAAASRERTRAQQQAATAARASQLLVEMFRLSDPDVAMGETITAREILERGTQRVETDFAHDPAFQAVMLRELGRVYQNLALFDDAERLVQRAVAVWRRSRPTPELASGIQQLGEIEAARAQYGTAEAHFRESLGMRRGLYRQPNDDLSSSMRGLADVLVNQRQFDEGESLYREALDVERRLHGEMSPHAASLLYSLAILSHDRGDFDNAESIFRQAVDMYRRIPDSRDPRAARARIDLAAVLLFRQRYAEAEPLYREAVELSRSIYPAGHPANVKALSGFGALLFNTSRFAAAESILREAIETGSPRMGPDHPDMLHVRQMLGAALSEQGRYTEADRWLSAVIEDWRARGEQDAPLTMLIQITRGENRLDAGSLRQAELDFNEALATARRVLGDVHPFTALALRGQARLALERDAPAMAEARLRDALAAFGPRMRANHHYVLGTKRSLAEALSLRGHLAEADSLLREVVTALRASMSSGYIEIGHALRDHGEVRLGMGDAAGAERLLREALTIQVNARGRDHWQVADTESVLGVALAVQGRQDEARPLLNAAYERLLALRGSSDRHTREARIRLERAADASDAANPR